MVLLFFKDCCPHVRVTTINVTLKWSFPLQRRVLPELAEVINTDPDPLVRSAAINATGQFLTALGPDLLLQYIPTLAEATYQDPDPSVRLAAINATGQLLPALARAICDFENPQFQEPAASAMINISKNYPLDTLTRDLCKTVGTLLQEHASSRSWFEKLKLQRPEYFAWEEIALDEILEEHASSRSSFEKLKFQRLIGLKDFESHFKSHQTRINQSKLLVMQFQKLLSHDTWDSIQSGLPPHQKEEFFKIWDSLCEHVASLILPPS